MSALDRKRLQHELDGVLREIRRLEDYYDKERKFHHRPPVGRPAWHDYDKKTTEAKDAARLKRMEETGKKISAPSA